MDKGGRQAIAWLAYWADWFALGSLAILCFAQDVHLPDAKHKPILFQGMVQWAQDNATLLGVAFLSAIPLLRLLRWIVREKHRDSRVIEKLMADALDDFRKACFPGIPDHVPVDHNRVTLFKHVQWKWWIWPWKGLLNPWGWIRYPWSGWLIVASRSGHVTQSSSAVFLAPDDAQHSEGVAGQAWRRQAYRVGKGENKLPKLDQILYYPAWYRIWLRLRIALKSTNESSAAYAEVDRTVNEYASATSVLPRAVWHRIKNRKVCPTSILGIPLQDQGERYWGVLVMDSCNEYECIDSDDPLFRSELVKLTRLLHRYGVMAE